jgi:hypothetical protein
VEVRARQVELTQVLVADFDSFGVCRGLGEGALKQRLGLGHIGRLSGYETPAGEVAESFDHGMDLHGQPAAGAANRLGPFFFLAPAAC